MANIINIVSEYIPVADIPLSIVTPTPHPPLTTSEVIVATIISPLFVVPILIFGIVLYRNIHKKILIIIPLIFCFFYLLRYLMETVSGYSFPHIHFFKPRPKEFIENGAIFGMINL